MSTNTTAPAGVVSSTEFGKAPKYSFCIHGQPMCNKCAESADFGENYVREWATYWRNRAISAEAQLTAERLQWTEAVMAELDGNGQAHAIVACATRAQHRSYAARREGRMMTTNTDGVSAMSAELGGGMPDAEKCECQRCCGKGWNWEEHQVAERKSDVQTIKVHCDKCEGTGYELG